MNDKVDLQKEADDGLGSRVDKIKEFFEDDVRDDRFTENKDYSLPMAVIGNYLGHYVCCPPHSMPIGWRSSTVDARKLAEKYLANIS